jgi:integrase
MQDQPEPHQFPSAVKVSSEEGDKCGVLDAQMLESLSEGDNHFTGIIAVSSTQNTHPQQQVNHEKKLLETYDAFLRDIELAGAAPNTINLYKQTRALVERAGLILDDFNYAEVKEKFAHALPAHWQRSTTLLHIRQLCRFGNWLASCHYTDRRHRSPNSKRRPKQREIISEEEARIMLCSLRDRARLAIPYLRASFERDWLMVWLLQETGCRVSECIELCIEDVVSNSHGCFATLRGTKTEDSERTIEITDELFINLQKHRQAQGIARGRVFRTRNGKAVERVTFGHWLTRYARGLKLSCHVTPHLFRYMYIMRKVAEGNSLLELMTRLGHSDPQMTVYYYNQVRRLMPWVKNNPDVSILEKRINYWRHRNSRKGGSE